MTTAIIVHCLILMLNISITTFWIGFFKGENLEQAHQKYRLKMRELERREDNSKKNLSE